MLPKSHFWALVECCPVAFYCCSATALSPDGMSLLPNSPVAQRQVLKSLSSKAPLTSLVVHILAFQALEFAKEFNALSYFYFPSLAMVLSLLLHMSKLDDEVSANGIIINTFIEIESGAIRALEELGKWKIRLSLAGPITQNRSSNDADESDKCLRWLDKQPPSSVLYVSFGSGGTLPQQQINELALGLELSCQRFLLVLRALSNSASATYLEVAKEDPLQFLPNRFLEKTKERGLVVPLWAPQV
ncbi:UDP-glycosyltransferase 72B1 [Spatholobus suberectus]|nr:UDP-glycosyltransferase 72B1 [Spatholobus suberectus]